MTLQEFIDRGAQQAKIGLTISPSELELTANSLLPQVFHDVANDYSGDGRTLPRLTKTLTFTNGVATLSSDVLTNFTSDAVLYDPADPTSFYSFVPDWDDFIRVYDTRLGYFTIRGGTEIYVIEPGSEYVDSDGLDGDLKLVISGVPAIPTSAGATIDAPAEFLTSALDLLVERLRGAIPEKVA